MSTGSPPAQPPMMSPDGKWVWNGQQWMPVAVQESVFPAYSTATAAANAAAPVAPAVNTPASPFAVAPPPATPAVVSPAIMSPPSYSAGGAVPPWQRQAAGKRSTYMYAGAAFAVLVIGVILVVTVGQNVQPFLHSSNSGTPTPTPKPSPTPQLAVRSQSAIADRYVNSTFIPAIGNLGIPIRHEYEACNGTLSFSCQDALNVADQQLTISLAAYGRSQPPPCIVVQAAKVLSDLNTMQAGAQAALKAFPTSNRVALQQGLAKFNNGNKPLQADILAVEKGPSLLCNGQPEGP